MNSMLKKAVSIILAMLMVLGGMNGLFVGGGTAYAAVSFAGGTGSSVDPYQIATADQLNEIRNLLGAGIYFQLTDDINLNVSPYKDGDGWLPIGNWDNVDEYPFRGNMDGNGYTITGLKIDRPDFDSSVGLFGYTDNASLSNMKLENIEIIGKDYVGGLVGAMYSGTLISNSSATGSVIGTGERVGGLVGDNGAVVSNSTATVSVSGTGLHVGGLAGVNSGTITNSTATGSVSGTDRVGGLVGYNNVEITNSYATGSVSGTDYVGGLVGSLHSGSTVSNSFATGRVSGTSNVGGLVGTNGGSISDSFYDKDTTGLEDNVGKGVPLSTSDMKDQNTYTDPSWDFTNTWGINSSRNNGYPYLRVFKTVTYDGNGDTGGNVPLDSSVYPQGVSASVYGNIGNLVKTDYVFAGWNTTGTVSEAVYAAEDRLRIVADTTLLAVWREKIAIATAAIAGVTAPEKDETPVTTVTETTSYTGTVTWSSSPATFAASTVYTATITLTPKAGYTLTSVGADFFTVAGATTVTNAADSGVITAVFPATAAPDAEIATAAIAGVTAPVRNETPVTTVTETTSYTGTVTWSSSPATFAASTVYTATITLTPKAGYTLTGVAADFFTVGGATATNDADSGVVTAVFPATAAAVTPSPPSSGGGGGGGGAAPAPTPVTGDRTTVEITPERGGTVSLDKVKVEIPVNALDSEFKVTVGKLKQSTVASLSVAKNMKLAGNVFEITKDKAGNFKKDITITLPFDRSKVDTEKVELRIFWYNEETKEWVKLDNIKVDLGAETVSGDVNHFTKFAVLAVDKAAESSKTDDPAETTPDINFRDISGHWAEATIQQAVSIGLVKGYADGTFKPGKSVTRAEFAVMLMNALKQQGAGAELTFTDAAQIGNWAQKSVAQAVQAGIITGYADGSFRPNAEITRAEMAMMIAKALKLSIESNVTTDFADDKNIPTWAKGTVAALKKLGIVNGKVQNNFDPVGQTTRAEAVTVLLNMLAQMGK